MKERIKGKDVVPRDVKDQRRPQDVKERPAAAAGRERTHGGSGGT